MAERISAERAHADLTSGKALLVCAYDSDDRFRECHLHEALSFADFRACAERLPKNQEIVFYCS